MATTINWLLQFHLGRTLKEQRSDLPASERSTAVNATISSKLIIVNFIIYATAAYYDQHLAHWSDFSAS